MALSFSSSTLSQKPFVHRVLARKYRPVTFKDLIGQESSTQILTNSIDMDRLPHAILLTGIRGIGKTTIARIIARALNCIGEDGQGGPTASPCGICEPCIAITEDRHIDVIEMDAASRTGVEDVREVIEGGRYKAVSARYKVYIIDEVHMLSKNAFNAFLKTLEEPSQHLIFIFATTELNKVPETIQSRCMRLPLRRIDLNTLIDHLKKITHCEGMKIDQGAVTLIAQAADGSVRDGLSLLDQAMALCEGNVDESSVLTMLGFSDRGLLFNLFIALIQGQPQEALQFFHQMYLNGSDPLTALHDLMDLIHWISLRKMSITSTSYPGLSEAYNEKLTTLIKQLSFPVLSRCWQTLIKGTQDVSLAPSTKQAVEIVLLQLCHLAALPTLHEVIQHLSEDSMPETLIEIETKTPPKIDLEISTPQDISRNNQSIKTEKAQEDVNSTELELELDQNQNIKDDYNFTPETLLKNDVEKPAIVKTEPFLTTNIDTKDHLKEKSTTDDLFPNSLSDFPDTTATSELSVEASKDNILLPSTLILTTFQDMLDLLNDKREMLLKNYLENDSHVISYESGKICLRFLPEVPKDTARRLKDLLTAWTNISWLVTIGEESGAPTVREQTQKKRAKKRTELLELPLVQSALATFPEAEIDDIEDHP